MLLLLLLFSLPVQFGQNCHNPNDNTTQPQHSCWVGYENDCSHPTPPTTTETQHQPPGAQDEHLLATTKYNVISNNKQGNNNNIKNNNNNNNNNINANSIVAFRSLR